MIFLFYFPRLQLLRLSRAMDEKRISHTFTLMSKTKNYSFPKLFLKPDVLTLVFIFCYFSNHLQTLPHQSFPNQSKFYRALQCLSQKILGKSCDSDAPIMNFNHLVIASPNMSLMKILLTHNLIPPASSSNASRDNSTCKLLTIFYHLFI